MTPPTPTPVDTSAAALRALARDLRVCAEDVPWRTLPEAADTLEALATEKESPTPAPAPAGVQPTWETCPHNWPGEIPTKGPSYDTREGWCRNPGCMTRKSGRDTPDSYGPCWALAYNRLRAHLELYPASPPPAAALTHGEATPNTCYDCGPAYGIWDCSDCPATATRALRPGEAIPNTEQLLGGLKLAVEWLLGQNEPPNDEETRNYAVQVLALYDRTRAHLPSQEPRAEAEASTKDWDGEASPIRGSRRHGRWECGWCNYTTLDGGEFAAHVKAAHPDWKQPEYPAPAPKGAEPAREAGRSIRERVAWATNSLHGIERIEAILWELIDAHDEGQIR